MLSIYLRAKLIVMLRRIQGAEFSDDRLDAKTTLALVIVVGDYRLNILCFLLLPSRFVGSGDDLIEPRFNVGLKLAVKIVDQRVNHTPRLLLVRVERARH